MKNPRKYFLIRVEWDWLFYLPKFGESAFNREYTGRKTEAMRFRPSDLEMAVSILERAGVSCIETIPVSYSRKPARVWEPRY